MEALHSATAGSEPDDETLSLDVTRFLQSLTDRQLQVMQGAMREKFTRDEITAVTRNIAKIVATMSRQIIVPKIKEENHSHSLELVARVLANGIVKTVYDSLNGNEGSRMLQPLGNGTEYDRNVSEGTKQTVTLPGTPTSSEPSEGKDKNIHLPTVKVTDERERPTSRGRVSMATLVDTMMTSLGLPGSGRFISLEELCAATKRADDPLMTTATQEFAEMVRLIVKDRLNTSDALLDAGRRVNPTDLEQNFTFEFLGEFSDESVKRLLMSCIGPQPASAPTEGPSLVMSFNVSPQSFEIARKKSEVFADTIDLFTKVIVNNIMDKVTALSDQAVVSNAEETPDIDSHSVEQLSTGRPVISVAALHHCIRAVLQRVQETSSTGVHGSSAVIDVDQIQKVTDDVKAILSAFTAVKVEDGQHAIKELHHSTIDAVYAELLWRISPKSDIIEAVRAQTQLLTGSLAISIVRAVKNTDAKDLYRPPSDTKGRASLATLLALRLLAKLGASSDQTKEVSSNGRKELIERILREFSASSSTAKLEEVLSDKFVKHLQRFGEEGSLRKALDPRDSAFDEALVTAFREHLGSEAPTAAPETEGNLKKRKSLFFRLKMPKISIFKKKPKKDGSDGSRSSDQDRLQSDRTADKGGSNSATSTKKKPSIFTWMFCCFRK